MSLVAGIGCPDTILKANAMNPTLCKRANKWSLEEYVGL